MPRKKLAIISTHPIQYYAPVFRLLAESPAVHPRVFFTWSQTAGGSVSDAGFGAQIQWDIPLLEGYEYEFVPNVARKPGVESFWGIRNPTLTRAVQAWAPDAVLVFGWNLHSHLQAMRTFKGRIPIFFRGDSTLIDAQPALRRLARKLFLHWVYRHIDVAIAVGRNNRDYFAHCGVPGERIAFAPHSIDTHRFADPGGSQEARAAAWRLDLGIGADDLVLLYAGKLTAKKDPLLLLDAHAQACARAHLVFCGNGALEDELMARARGRPRVHFLPFQNQRAMPAVYRIGDVFVLPSRGPGESWGLALNEAMASGRPAIASSKAGATRDLIRHGSNGWVFEAGDRADLAALLRTIESTERRALRSMGEAARRTSLAWSSEAAAGRISEIVAHFA